MSKVKPYRKFSKSAISEHLESYVKSGLSVSNYCKEHNLARQTFYAWRLSSDPGKKKKSTTTKKFIPLEIINPTISSGNIYAEISFPNGSVVRFFDKVEASVLHLLLKSN
jgi:hypothetical protein